MAQKLLFHAKRDRRSRAKDILYLHDTIELGGSLEELGEQWVLAKRGLSESAIRTVETAVDTLFSKVTDDVRSAVQAAGGRRVTPEGLQELCRSGFKIIFRPETVTNKK